MTTSLNMRVSEFDNDIFWVDRNQLRVFAIASSTFQETFPDLPLEDLDLSPGTVAGRIQGYMRYQPGSYREHYYDWDWGAQEGQSRRAIR
eukprot:1323973-Karenia_brevis.AAC.1